MGVSDVSSNRLSSVMDCRDIFHISHLLAGVACEGKVNVLNSFCVEYLYVQHSSPICNSVNLQHSSGK